MPRSTRFPRQYFARKTLEVARGLVGTHFVRETTKGRISGIIAETEAYCGITDPASHAYAGRKTNRTVIMYGPAGYAYVYFVYGMHHCFNVVTDRDGTAGAVLLRGIIPLDGIELITRNADKRYEQVNGPGKLCRAYGITKKENGLDLCGGDSTIYFSKGLTLSGDEVHACPRIGIGYAGEAKYWPWRFVLRGHGYNCK
ncbi:MAG: DNA-3-methyladenine glycosylase [Elusimicrobiota bacterium]